MQIAADWLQAFHPDSERCNGIQVFQMDYGIRQNRHRFSLLGSVNCRIFAVTDWPSVGRNHRVFIKIDRDLESGADEEVPAFHVPVLSHGE